MKIWLDGDACPKAVKDVLFRAVIRTKTDLVIVANHYFPTPASPFIKKLQVGSGFDVADNKIVEEMQKGDLVITADIPLADAVISKDGIALNPRGMLYSKENIKHTLAMRNLNESLRSNGVLTGGPPTLNQRTVEQFANSLDRILAKIKK